MFHGTARGAIIRYFAAFCLAVAVLWTAIVLTLGAAHDRIVERVTVDERNLVHSLAENVASSFRTIDLALIHLRDAWVRDRATFASAAADEVDFLKRESIAQVSVIGADGRLVWSNMPGWRPLDLSDREHFQVHRQRGTDVLYISQPILGRVSKKLTIQFTRPLLDRNGRFAGVMNLSVPPGLLERIYNNLKIAEGGNISLVRTDGVFLARSQNFQQATKMVLPVNATPGLRPGDPIAGEYRHINAIEKVDSFISYHGVSTYPVVVYVREPADKLLAGYYTQRRVLGWSGAFVTALLLLMTLLGIAKQRDNEQAAFRSARVTAMIENANDAIIARTLDGAVTSWNAAAERLFGYTAQEIHGRTGVLTPPDRAQETARNRALIGEGKAIPPYETVRLAKDGRKIDVSFSASPIKNERGEVIGMANIIREISERKRADEARARLAAIIESASDAIIGRTLDGKVTSWNAAAERMFGYTLEEINGRADLLTPRDKLDESVLNRTAIKAGRAIEAYETVRVTKDGRRIDVVLSGSPVKNERGEIIGMANILRDNTESKRIGETLRVLAQHSARTEVLELLRPLTRYLCGALEVDMVCIVRLDKDGLRAKTLAVFADGDFRDDFVYALDGSPCEELLKGESITFPADVCKLFPRNEVLLQFGAESYIGVALRGADGAPIGLIAAIGRQPVGNVRLAESILKLVAVRVEGELERELIVEALRRSEGDLAALNADLETNVARRTADLRVINEELESFSYSVAHDLRAPLRAIGGFSALVLGRNEDKLDATSIGHLHRIKTNAERMAELIDDLLNLTRVSRQQAHRADMDMSAVARSVFAALADAQPQRRVETVTQPAMKVSADPGLVRVLLENLIGNAWKFTAGVPAARIEVGSEVRDSRLVYFVRDNGAGFDMAYVNKLFAPFQRLHGQEEFEGTGIGLSIVRRVVMKHGGSVWGEGRIDQGAVFYFTFG